MSDIVIETLRALILALLLFVLWYRGKKEALHTMKGWREVLIGLALILFGALLDITDNFPSLNDFEVIGHTHTEAFLEKVVGYLAGYVFMFIGFWQWIPLAGKQAEEALRKSEESYRAVFNESVAPIYLFDQNKRFIDTNQAGIDLLGYSRDELLSMCIPDVDADPFAVLPAHEQLLNGGRLVNYEHRLRCKDGHIITVLNNSRPLTNAQGQVIGMLSTIIDITERKKAEQMQRESELRLKAMIEALPIPIALNNDQGEITYLNPAFIKAFGYTRDDIPHLSAWWSRAYPDIDYRQWVVDTWAAHLEQTRIHATSFEPVELRVCAKNGEFRIVKASAALPNADYLGEHLVALFDITERVSAEMALQESKNVLQAVIEHLPMRVFWKDNNLNYLGCNTAFARDAGKCLPSEMIGKDDYQMAWDKQADLLHTDDRQVIESGIPKLNFEEPQTTPDGKQIWLRTSKVPLKNVKGELFGILGMYDDITEYKQNEEELHRYRNELEYLVQQRTAALQNANEKLTETQFAMNAVGIGIHWVDMHSGRFVLVNHFAANLLGYSVEEMMQLSVSDIDPNFPTEKYNEIVKVIKNNGRHKFETVQKTKQGALVSVEVTVYYLGNNEGRPEHLVSFVTDMSERKAAEQRTRQLVAILDKSPDLISTATMDGEIKYLNPAGFHMVGMSEEIDLSQKHIPDFHPAWACSKVLNEGIPATLIQGGWQGETALQHTDGHEIPVFQTILVHQDELGKPSYLSTIIRDISKQKSDEQALLAAKAAAEAASMAKSSFLANMSHEIRTPMSGVIGMIDVLFNTQLTPEQKRIASIIRDSANAQLAILNDILDFSKIEAGKLELAPEPFSPKEVLDKACALLDSLANSKNVSLVGQLDPAIPVALEGDVLRVRQILMNFVTNAIKFSAGGNKQGKVAVSISMMGERGGKVWLEFSVQDNGIGMDAKTRERIFQPFTQADSSTTKRFGGTGLGLVITLRLVEMMGGTLHVDSAPNQGSTFTARLPFLRADSIASAVSTDASSTSLVPLITKNSSRKILVAEDNETNQEVIRQQLRILGYQNDIADDGREAFALWLKGDYALLITDLHMPNMDGYQLTEAIRAQERQVDAHRTPIVALTANALKGEAEHCKQLGMDDYQTKPLPISLLKEMLEKWMTDGVDAAGATLEKSKEAEHGLALFDSEMLTKIVGDDLVLHQMLLEDFLVSTQERVSELLVADNIATITQVAHSLKSASRSVGAMQMGELCEQIEKTSKMGNLAFKDMLPTLETTFDKTKQAICLYKSVRH